jgi:hypothetical protein
MTPVTVPMMNRKLGETTRDKPVGSIYLSTEACPIKVVDTAPSNNMRANEIGIESAKTSKVTAVVAVMSIFCRKRCKSWSANPEIKKLSRQKKESANFLEKDSRKPRDLSLKTRKGLILKKLVPTSKKIELNSNILEYNCKRSCLDCTKKPVPSVRYMSLLYK